VIDPVIRYSTYLGGVGEDVGYAVAVDNTGNVYVGGLTVAYNFPGSVDFGQRPSPIRKGSSPNLDPSLAESQSFFIQFSLATIRMP